ncbi:hypothetical protein [Aliarcobacter cryaerophilus]|uniref:hypothetical protein n=1 Tax=Aliarcobacter cryaerophilus TaxID=28198 RepID=UPI000825102E|nr:hypothetical protein [Aliarcobacter cryaerophilus]
MKKGVVLLVTLFFIMAITILILANLSDTKNYLDKRSLKFTKIQMLYYVNNIKNEILKEIKNISGDNLNRYYNMNFFYDIENIKINIKLQEYNKYNINLFRSKDEKDYFYLSEFLKSYEIYDIYAFKSILNEFDSIKSNKQLNEVFRKLEQEIYPSNSLSEVKNYIGFINFDKKTFFSAPPDKDLLVELFIEVEYEDNIMNAYYILKKNTQGVEYFEYSFK